MVSGDTYDVYGNDAGPSREVPIRMQLLWWVLSIVGIAAGVLAIAYGWTHRTPG